MNVVIGAGGQPKKREVPHRRQNKTNEHNAPWESLRREQLTDREQVCDSGQRQRRHEVRAASIAKIERADR